MNQKNSSSVLSIESADFKTILDSLPRLVMLIDLDGTIVYWNTAGEDVFGYTAEESIGRPVWNLYPDRDEVDFMDELEILENGETVSVDLEGAHKNGSTVWMDVKRKMIQLDNGSSLILSSGSDISMQVKAEQDLAANERRLESILETAVEGIITIDKQGIIKSFNAAAASIFGYDADEVIGNNVSMLMPAPYHKEHDGYIERYLRTGERKIIGIGREVRGRRKDGTVFPMELSVNELELDGEIFFTGLLRDISERRELENELLRVSEEERRRIGRDLHDGLGQMLTGIGLISQNLARKLKANALPGADEVQEIYEMIREADEQAKALARGLSNIELEAEQFSDVIGHFCTRAKRLFDIDCEIDFDEEITLDDDITKLHLFRIVQEAVHNAVKHGKASKVKVHLHRKDNYVRLAVEDNGIGFEETKSKDKIKGLGMNTMNYRAHILGGHLDVTESEEGNTLIICTIPDIELMKT